MAKRPRKPIDWPKILRQVNNTLLAVTMLVGTLAGLIKAIEGLIALLGK